MREHRILVTGSRDWSDPGAIYRTLHDEVAFAKALGRRVTIIHGGCPTGADMAADTFARTRFLNVEVHRAKWSLGRKAGPRRNQEMVDSGADVCLAFIRNSSPGATGCARMAVRAGIETRYYREA